MNDTWVIGAGGHSRVVIDTLRLSGNVRIAGIIDINKNDGNGESILGARVYGMDAFTALGKDIKHAVLAVGSNSKRREIGKKLEVRGILLESVIHPDARISEYCSIGRGSFIAYGASVGPLAVIGAGCIVNTMANVEHEVTVGSYSQLGPGAVICGRSIVGKNTFMGASSTVIDGIKVADDCVVGAGSVILRDIIEPGSKLVGIPGRVL